MTAAQPEGKKKKGRPFSTSTENRADAVAAYQEGCTTTEVAAMYAVTPETVSKWLAKAGVEARRRGPIDGKIGLRNARLRALLEACRAHRKHLPAAVKRAVDALAGTHLGKAIIMPASCGECGCES